MMCHVAGYPEPKIKWEFNGEIISEDDEERQIVQYGEVCQLVIPNVLTKHSGEYHCIAENSQGVSFTSGYLSVGGEDTKPSPPYFVRCLYDISTPLEETVRLVCQVVGQPLPDITWYKDGEEIVENKNLEVFFEPNNICILVIKKVTTKDLGVYSCEAKNEHGAVRTNALVKVGRRRTGQPPIFLKGLMDQTTVVGGRITMGVLLRDEKVVKITQEYVEKVHVERVSEGKTCASCYTTSVFECAFYFRKVNKNNS